MKKFSFILLVSFVVFSIGSCITYYAGYEPPSDAHVINRKYDIVGDVSVLGEQIGVSETGAYALILQKAKDQYGDENVDEVVSIQATQLAHKNFFGNSSLRGLIFEGKAIKYTD